MALKRLDEEFELKPGTQLLPYMKRLLPSLEGRFQSVEATAKQYSELIDYIRAAAVLRMNEILIPATEDIIAVTKLGFLLAPSSTLTTLTVGPMYFIVDEGPQRDTFTPSPYLIIERKDNIDDYAIARMLSYSQDTGQLDLSVTAVHGNAGPHSDWVISSTPGMADSTKLYHDAIAPMYAEVEADTAEVAIKHQEILDAAQSLEEAGLDLFNYVRRDGTVPFQAPQTGVAPIPGSNDATLVTSAWSRARMIEYAGDALMKAGGTMSGPLSLSGLPSQPAHAASKAYVDSIIGQGGVIQNSVTLRTVSPYLRLQSTGTLQSRMVEATTPAGASRWQMVIADATAESGGNAGSNWVLNRFSDAGTLIDTALSVNRATGALSTKAINYTGSITGTGDVVVFGDLKTYRSGSPNTGVLYMNQAATAYHHFDGATHNFVGGSLSTNGATLFSGSLNCRDIYTNGYPATVWGITCHGNSTINGSETINGNLRLNGAGSNMIELWDNDWGSMYIHHNNDLIGFLSNGAGWVMYVTNAGHVWWPQYGWLHDYVNGRAYAYFQSAVQHCRWVYVGDWWLPNYAGWGLVEPYGGTAVTGWAWDWSYALSTIRHRQLQMYRPDQGGWFGSYYA